MRSKKFLLLPAACLSVLLAVSGVFASSALTLNLPDPEANNVVVDEEIPEVTARVSRISFIRGDVQIRRLDSREWERATLNLPIVEGDEITTSADARIEIQFNTYNYLRLDENSFLKVVNLKDEGIAVSLPEGTMSVRTDQFDKDVSYFEIDGPNTTVAVQKSGFYRIDAGKQGDNEVRVSILDKGEARIYSDNSGFTLKSGRSARVYIAGDNVGEWDTGSAGRDSNEFDTWAFNRDATIAANLKNSHYDKYYDRDIYGAEELNDNGEWVYTKKYGYVWRPYRSSINSYANWSPYRYGTWRWIAPYGWTWVNDEPWGWATYHHGRWLYDDGYWNWSPYGYYRNARSWWSPALVVFTSYGSNYCWYPLPYSYSYYNYNLGYYNNHHNGGNNGNNGPVPTPTPNVAGGPITSRTPRPGVSGDPTTSRTPTPITGSNYTGLVTKKIKTPPLGMVPPTGIVMVEASEFGRGTKTRTPPLATANDILTRIPDDRQTAPQLPNYNDLGGRVSTSIKATPPPVAIRVDNAKTGATTRTTDRPLDNELRNTRIFGNRLPLVKAIDPVRSEDNPPTTRSTGAVDRVPDRPVRQPQVTPPTSREEPVRQEPTYSPPPRQREETPRAPIRETPRYDPPPTQRETPRYEPPVRNDPPPRQRDPEPVRQPPREEPKPQPKADPPPTKDGGDERKKDGR